MPDYRNRPQGEQHVLDWLARWPERRTLRELFHVLVTVHEIQTDGTGDPDAYVAQLLDGGTRADLEAAMTEAIAYLVATEGWGRDWADGLTRAHGELRPLFPRHQPTD